MAVAPSGWAGSLMPTLAAQMFKTAVEETGNVIKHHREHPDPKAQSAGAKVSTIGLVNIVNTSTDNRTPQQERRTTLVESFTHGVAFTAGAAVIAAAGSYIYNLATRSQSKQTKREKNVMDKEGPVFEGEHHPHRCG